MTIQEGWDSYLKDYLSDYISICDGCHKVIKSGYYSDGEHYCKECMTDKDRYRNFCEGNIVSPDSYRTFDNDYSDDIFSQFASFLEERNSTDQLYLSIKGRKIFFISIDEEMELNGDDYIVCDGRYIYVLMCNYGKYILLKNYGDVFSAIEMILENSKYEV